MAFATTRTNPAYTRTYREKPREASDFVRLEHRIEHDGMTNKVDQAILVAKYGSATKELTDLVMAAERGYDQQGKRSIFGRDKSKEADELLSRAVVRAIARLSAIGIISSNDLKAQIDALTLAMRQTEAAYPNWPNAYRYLERWLDEFVKPMDMSPVVASWMEESRRRRANLNEK